MIFISLGRFRSKPTKEATNRVSEIMKGMTQGGIKFLGFYWTLGRFDTVVIMEAPDEKTVMKANMKVSDIVSTETMVALTREEAHKLIEEQCSARTQLLREQPLLERVLYAINLSAR
jgi:uncharacterized protein with GYD domain